MDYTTDVHFVHRHISFNRYSVPRSTTTRLTHHPVDSGFTPAAHHFPRRVFARTFVTEMEMLLHTGGTVHLAVQLFIHSGVKLIELAQTQTMIAHTTFQPRHRSETLPLYHGTTSMQNRKNAGNFD
jgi:hypothetical protein